MQLEQPCAVNFWTFAAPVVAGNIASRLTGLALRHYYRDEANTTRDTAAMFAKFGAFWLVAGATWIAMNRRNGAAL